MRLFVCVFFSFIFVSFHSCRSWAWYTWTVISVWIRRLKMTVRCPASRTAPGAARNSGSSATSHCPRYSEIAHGWTDGQTHTATLMERERERERTAFLSILVVCLQNDLKEQNRICIWISPSLHLAEEKKKNERGRGRLVEKETWVWCPYPPRPRSSGHFGYVYENASLLEYQCVRVYVCVWLECVSHSVFHRRFFLFKYFSSLVEVKGI